MTISDDRLTDIATSYSTRLGTSFTALQEPMYGRIVERVAVDAGACRRTVSVDWTLPTLGEALPQANPTELAVAAEQLATVTVPVLLMRRGQLLTGLTITSPDVSVFLCSNEESERCTEEIMTFAWTELEDRVLSRLGQDRVGPVAAELAGLLRRYLACVRLPRKESDRELAMVVQELERLNRPYLPERQAIRQVLRMGRYFTRRHVFWVRIEKKPGDGVRLEYSFITRFAPEYSPADGRNKILELVGKLRRFIGQHPNMLDIPVSRNGLARSYHFEMDVPPDCYVRRQAFILERNQSDTENVQTRDMDAYCATHGARVLGRDEGGGGFAHLYGMDLPSEVRNQIFARVRFSERPPGTTAVVLWMLLFATLASGGYALLWEQVTRADSQGVDVAALFVALPALAIIWFARAFRDDIRPRVPLVSRLGIFVTALGTMYALFSVLLNRSICRPKAADGTTISACPDIMVGATGRTGMVVVFLALSLTTAVVVGYRGVAHVTYRRYQRTVQGRYGR